MRLSFVYSHKNYIMYKSISIGIIIFALMFSSYTYIWQTSWNIQQDDYIISFETQKVTGKIKGLEGKILFDENKLQESEIDVSVDVNTIATGFWLKNNHAKSENFLNAEKHPKITFKSQDFKKTSAGYLVLGTLQIKGISKEISIPFTFDREGTKGTFQGNFDINRTDFNLIKNGIGTILHVKIRLPVYTN